MNTIETMIESITDICTDWGAHWKYSADLTGSLICGLPFESLYDAIMVRAEPVHAYATNGQRPLTLKYRGEKLFDQNATLLWREPSLRVEDDDLSAVRYMELWMLDDMTLAVVSCVQIDVGEDADFVTEYREYKGPQWPILEPVPDLVDFLDRLTDLCPREFDPDEDVVYEP